MSSFMQRGSGGVPMQASATVVIPAYNAQDTIERAIRSALDQVTVNVEVVVVDDNSSDRTAEIAEGFARADDRLVVIRNQTNQGPSRARNAGIALANGTFIAPLDADDRFHPRRLEVLIAAAERCGSDLVCDNLHLVPQDRSKGLPPRAGGPYAFPDSWLTAGPVTLVDLLARDQGDHGSKWEFGFAKPIIRRSFLEQTGIRYDPNLRLGEDFLLYAECLMAGARFDTVPDALYDYTVATGTLRDNRRGYLVLSDINQRLRDRLSARDDQLQRLLRSRQSHIEYAALRRAVLSLDIATAARFVRSIPKPYLASRLTRVAVTRTLQRARPA